MPIRYIHGDILANVENWDLMFHSCNNKGVMNSGIAKSLRDKWPLIYEIYKEMDYKLLGNISYASVEQDKRVVNIIGQADYGYNGKQYVNYEALDTGIERIVRAVNYFNKHRDWLPPIEQIATVLIGAGLGGGNWRTIEQILEKHFTDMTLHVYVLDLNTYNDLVSRQNES